MPSIDFSRLCLGCMNMLPHPKATCPNCGWSRNSSQNNTFQLQQNSTLKNPDNGNEYLIGSALGNGGFGIVYIAWDESNNRRVAIKEYFPTQFVARTQASTVVLQNDSQANRDFYEKQKKRFRQEAVKMQMFNDSPNVVNVFDYFEQNNTAYIVMEFIEGQTLLQILERLEKYNQRMDLTTIVSNIGALVDILEKIHHTPYHDDQGNMHQGMIHRDISPENIIFASDGSIKLLDFGAARVSDPGKPPTGIIKVGYSPYEQMLSVGPQAQQGSWTDVYALAATIYRAITGQLPPDSVNRAANDTIILPSAFGISITPKQEQILMKGLAVKYPERYQSVRQFYTDLYNSTVNPPPKQVPILQVGKFERDGDNYKAFINYNGDGILKTNVINATINATINGIVLIIPKTEVDGKGGLNGTVSASQGNNYAETSTPFYCEEIPDGRWKKILWGLAAAACVVTFLFYNKLDTKQNELNQIKEKIQTNEKQLEKYRAFAEDYGYGSSHYYSEKAIVFINKNSEAKLPIYCDLLVGTDKNASFQLVNNNASVSAEWESAFGEHEKNKSNIVIKSVNSEGYSTLKLTNEVNSDNFEVLIVVQ
ncbi:MAG: serine/threonine protein kinase [Selenomonadaceae bacterium]|nr:serine/threonine protein kinase [Selenomonadaceae bacterium]